jgi:hypothetical protein
MTRRAGWIVALVLLAGCSGRSGVDLTAASATPPPAAEAPSAAPAGTYTSTAFQPPVTYTLPEGWQKPSDTPAYFALQPAGSSVAGIFLFRDPQPASQDAACTVAAEPDVGTLSTELAAWIRQRPGLNVGNPRMVTIGGLRGVEFDVSIANGWTQSCPFAGGLPAVPLFVRPADDMRWVVAGSERLRLALLDVPGGGTVAVDVDAFDGGAWDALLAAAAPIVERLEFSVP